MCADGFQKCLTVYFCDIFVNFFFFGLFLWIQLQILKVLNETLIDPLPLLYFLQCPPLIKGTGSPDGMGSSWHIWIDLGLKKGRGWFLNF
jgi:hypothetical protein